MLDSLGNRLYSDNGLAVEGPASAAQRIEIKLIDLDGSPRLGDEPLAATLCFDGRSSGGSIRMESDAEGSFQGVLPRKGVWRIESESKEPALQTWTRSLVTLVEDRAVGPIELSVRPLKELTGTVSSSRGVGGGRSDRNPFLSFRGWRRSDTDDMGGCSVRVPESASRLVAIVSAPGFAAGFSGFRGRSASCPDGFRGGRRLGGSPALGDLKNF